MRNIQTSILVIVSYDTKQDNIFSSLKSNPRRAFCVLYSDPWRKPIIVVCMLPSDVVFRYMKCPIREINKGLVGTNGRLLRWNTVASITMLNNREIRAPEK
jgi:hypothetical protein